MASGCSHGKAVRYFTESIKAGEDNMAFLAYPMGNSNRRDSVENLRMGEPLKLDKKKVGSHRKFYVEVTPHKPYYPSNHGSNAKPRRIL